MVEKRIVARAFNEMLSPTKAKVKATHDGRTERRRARLLRDLTGEGKKALKPLKILGMVADLIELGETLGTIRKARAVPRPRPESPEMVALVERLHAAYAFPSVAYRFVGVGDGVLAKAGIKPRARKGTSRSKRTK